METRDGVLEAKATGGTVAAGASAAGAFPAGVQAARKSAPIKSRLIVKSFLFLITSSLLRHNHFGPDNI
jgi:hypothetical protein